MAVTTTTYTATIEDIAAVSSGVWRITLANGQAILSNNPLHVIAYDYIADTSVKLNPYVNIANIGYHPYNALLNNASTIANAANVQRVDYSNGSLTPINIDQIRDNVAEKADIQEYVYNSAGYIRGRYHGEQLVGANINEYTVGDISYGTTPVLESTTPYFCVFDYISGFSPEHNEANAIVIAYIIDEEGNLYTPDSPQALALLKQGFPAQSEVELSVQTSAIGGSEATLSGTQEILRGGSRIEPLIYSYTATTYLSPIYSGASKLAFVLPDPQPATYNVVATGATPQTLGTATNAKTVLTFTSETKDDQSYFASNIFALGEDTEQRIKFEFNGTLEALGYLQPGGYYTTGNGIVKLEKCTDSTFDPTKTTAIAYQTFTHSNSFIDINLSTPLDSYTSGSRFRVVVEVNSQFDSLEAFDKHFNVFSEYSGSAYLPASASFTTGSGLSYTLTASVDLSGKYGSYFEGISGSASSGFNGVNLRFEPQVGDEVKFNNDEYRSYMITDVITPAESSTGKLYLTLDKPMKSTDNVNFFAIRRYVDANNMILMKTEKVAGTQNTGILYPKYPSKRLAENYEKIISDLKTKTIL